MATSLSITNAPIRILVKNNDSICYEAETIAEYKTIAGDYKVIKYGDNSIIITETNKNYENELKMDNKGNVKIKTQDKKHLGLFTDYKTYKFKIKKFNTTNLEINDNDVDNQNIKQVIESLENYINSNALNDTNYIELLGEDLMDPYIMNDYNVDEVKRISKEQYNDTYYNYINDLNDNNFTISTSNSLVLGSALAGISNEGALAITGEALCPEAILLVALLAGLCAAEVYISGGSALTLDDIDYTYYDDNVDITDNTKWATIDSCIDIVKETDANNDGRTDYYQAIVASENNVYINYANPLTVEEAANLLKSMNNIYTFNPSDAINAIKEAGGIASNGRNDETGQYTNKAECHAYTRSFDSYDSSTLSPNESALKFKQSIKPGIYYWHFHFQKLPGEVKNPAHSFYGTPVIVTQEDIDNLTSQNINFDIYKFMEYLTAMIDNKKAKALVIKRSYKC